MSDDMEYFDKTTVADIAKVSSVIDKVLEESEGKISANTLFTLFQFYATFYMEAIQEAAKTKRTSQLKQSKESPDVSSD